MELKAQERILDCRAARTVSLEEMEELYRTGARSRGPDSHAARRALRAVFAQGQYVIAASKEMPRDALHLHHTRYWQRRDARGLADPNPFVLRKLSAAEES